MLKSINRHFLTGLCLELLDIKFSHWSPRYCSCILKGEDEGGRKGEAKMER